MFGSSDSKSKSKGKAAAKQNKGSLNSIVHGTKIKGDIVSDSDIRIDGELVGSLECAGKLIIGESGAIDGEVKCDSAVIQGVFTGRLIVDNTLDVKATGKINGEIKTEKLIVEAGALFNVHCQMGDKAFGTSQEPFIENRNTKGKPS